MHCGLQIMWEMSCCYAFLLFCFIFGSSGYLIQGLKFVGPVKS
jgi:hypothetical protein